MTKYVIWYRDDLRSSEKALRVTSEILETDTIATLLRYFAEQTGLAEKNITSIQIRTDK